MIFFELKRLMNIEIIHLLSNDNKKSDIKKYIKEKKFEYFQFL